MATYTATTSPMIITTAATVVSTRPFLAKEIIWINPTTVGHTCVIADLNGNVITQGVAGQTVAAVTLWPGPAKLTLKGSATVSTGSWQVSTIASGSLMIWF